MINLEFLDAGGNRVKIEYDVHPLSQAHPIQIPTGAVSVIIWLGTHGA